MTQHSRRRIRRSRSEWQQLVEEHARSGLSQSAFCTERGISVTSLRSWKRRLTAQAHAEPAREPQCEPWLELGTVAGRAEPSGWDIELELGNGLCLRLRRC
jgi:transposase-like protein